MIYFSITILFLENVESIGKCIRNKAHQGMTHESKLAKIVIVKEKQTLFMWLSYVGALTICY